MSTSGSARRAQSSTQGTEDVIAAAFGAADASAADSNAASFQPWALDGSPLHRALSLMERISTRDSASTLQELTQETGQPKATLHRMLQQLEEAGMVARLADGKHYTTGIRLRRMAEQTLLTDIEYGARHRVLAQLVANLRESCNITALSGEEVLYLDRVETPEPLRFTLGSGTRVPAHASASGKLLLSQLSAPRRRRLLESSELQAFTETTITDPQRLEEEIAVSAERGYAIDDGEFLSGLVCVAVAVPDPSGRSNLAIAVQGPKLRLPAERCPELVPQLVRAAQGIARIEHGEFPGIAELEAVAAAAPGELLGESDGESGTEAGAESGA